MTRVSEEHPAIKQIVILTIFVIHMVLVSTYMVNIGNNVVNLLLEK